MLKSHSFVFINDPQRSPLLQHITLVTWHVHTGLSHNLHGTCTITQPSEHTQMKELYLKISGTTTTQGWGPISHHRNWTYESNPKIIPQHNLRCNALLYPNTAQHEPPQAIMLEIDNHAQFDVWNQSKFITPTVKQLTYTTLTRKDITDILFTEQHPITLLARLPLWNPNRTVPYVPITNKS